MALALRSFVPVLLLVLAPDAVAQKGSGTGSTDGGPGGGGGGCVGGGGQVVPGRGRYPGPGDTVPPLPDLPGAAPRPSAPGAAQPATPGRPGVAPPGATPPPRLTIPETARLAELDRTEWWDWWDYNREQFLEIDAALARLHPTTPRADGSDNLPGRRAGVDRALVYDEVVPALLEALEREGDPAFRRRVLLALGQIGEAPDTRDALFAEIRARLEDGHMGVAEAAVVGLGTLGTSSSVRLLSELVLDSKVGREAVGRRRVPVRMRALAAYGLGVSGSADIAPAVRTYAAHSLVEVLSTDVDRYPDMQAAAVIALGLCPVASGEDRGPDAPPSSSRPAQVRFLLELFDDDHQPRMVRTHVPTSIARLVGAGEFPASLREVATRRVLRALDRGEEVGVRRSAVIALGQLADGDDDPLDRRVRTQLEGLLHKGDLPSRSFAALALAQSAARYGDGAGGPRAAVAPVARLLTKQLVRGKSFERPWAALALGVLGFELRAAGESLPQSAADALRGELRRERNPLEATAFALGLGMIGDQGALETVSERLVDEGNDDYASLFATALGLFRDSRARAVLLNEMEDAIHRPDRMEHAALGRALIGDRMLLDELVERLDDCPCGVSTRGVCRALGWSADDRAVAPLLALLRDPGTNTWTRMNAVEALGRIADRSNMPWDVRISAGLNYLDAPSSLTDPSGFGILDTF